MPSPSLNSPNFNYCRDQSPEEVLAGEEEAEDIQLAICAPSVIDFPSNDTFFPDTVSFASLSPDFKVTGCPFIASCHSFSVTGNWLIVAVLPSPVIINPFPSTTLTRVCPGSSFVIQEGEVKSQSKVNFHFLKESKDV